MNRKLIQLPAILAYTHAAISLGRGRIADASADGISKASIRDLVEWSQRIGVLKGWGLWTPEALTQLKCFVRWAVKQKSAFNLEGMRRAIAAREEHIGNIMQLIQDDKTFPPPSRKSEYFCSEFIVACFSDAGLLGPKAKVVFKPDTYTPRMLVDDQLFGRFSGYISKDGRDIPSDDPFLHLLI